MWPILPNGPLGRARVARRLAEQVIPLSSRITTIADIYDALTAGDRPYKRAVSRDEALDILSDERRAGHVDATLLDLFVDAKLWELVPAAVSPRPAGKRRPRR